jgi:PTH1 family peptidyl-tRNA hydrolase
LKPRILFGLGNPGSEYENTPHNVGENAVRAWAARARLEFEKGDGQYYWTPVRRGVRAVVPTTYMNLSGQALSKLRAIMDLEPAEVLGTQQYPRLRLGVGPVPERKDWADFVLEPFRSNQSEEVSAMYKEAVNAINLILARGYGKAQTEVNRSPEPESEDSGSESEKSP